MRKLIYLSSISLLIIVSLVQTISVVGAAADARKIMESVYNQDTSRDASWRAAMDVTDKKGGVRQKKFLFRRSGSLGNSKTLVRFVEPADVRGVGLLSFNHKGDQDRQWLFTPAIQRTRRVAPQERSRKFLGTDFTHEDMEERLLDDFEYRIINESEQIDGRACYKIEAKPIAPDRSQYKTLYLWVPHDTPYTILAELYDEKLEKIRVYHATDLQKVSGIWIAKRIEMITIAESTKTVLMIDEIKFNTSLKEDLFTLQALEKADLF